MKVLAPGAGTRISGESAIAIGTFDGVHLGHRRLLEELARHAKARQLSTAVVTFDPHPATVVHRESAPFALNTLSQKLDLIANCGISQTLVVPFDRARADESAEDFVRNVLIGDLLARLVVVGKDFHFGRGREGNVAVLTELGRTYGFNVVGMRLHSCDGGPISSSRIRRLIADGDIERAAQLLGRPHCVIGSVLEGTPLSISGQSQVSVVTIPAMFATPKAGMYAGRVARLNGSSQVAVLEVTSAVAGRTERLIRCHAIDLSPETAKSVDDPLVAVSFTSALQPTPTAHDAPLTTRVLETYAEQVRSISTASSQLLTPTLATFKMKCEAYQPDQSTP
jgi:riboflavin kinase/FMN adenylyltransferase